MDGANVEMAEEMGLDNIFIFGMTIDEVAILQARGYDAMEFYNASPELAKVIDQLKDGTFSKNNDPNEFIDVVNNLLYHDRFLTLADFDAYIIAQDKVSETYRVIIFYILLFLVVSIGIFLVFFYAFSYSRLYFTIALKYIAPPP